MELITTAEFNKTTDKENEVISREINRDLKSYIDLFKEQITEYMRKNPDLTVAELEAYIVGLLDGTQEIT